MDKIHTGEPIIRPQPTLETFKTFVDQLVAPEADFNDDQATAFINIVLTLANPEDNHIWFLAKESARHAFTKTRAFEVAFADFAGFPDRCPFPTDKMTILAPREM